MKIHLFCGVWNKLYSIYPITIFNTKYILYTMHKLCKNHICELHTNVCVWCSPREPKMHGEMME